MPDFVSNVDKEWSAELRKSSFFFFIRYWMCKSFNAISPGILDPQSFFFICILEGVIHNVLLEDGLDAMFSTNAK